MLNEWGAPSRNRKRDWTRTSVSFGKRLVLIFETLLCFQKIFVYNTLLNKCVLIAWAILFCSSSYLLKPLIKKEGSIDRNFTLTYGPRLSSFSEERTIASQFPSLKAPPADSLAPAQAKDSSLWGFINLSGRWVVQPKFEEVGAFWKGIAPIIIKGRAGFVDRTGRITLIKPPRQPAIHLHAGSSCDSNFHEMSLPVYMGKNYMTDYDGKTGMVDCSGHWLIQPFYAFEALEQCEFSNGAAVLEDELSIEPDWKYFKLSRDSKYGVADLDGKILMQCKYKDISSFNKGKAAVKFADHFGFVDSSGKIVIEPKYEQVTPFDDLIGVKCEGKWSLINSRGLPVQCPKLDGVVYEPGHQWFSNGLAGVQVNKMCGFIDAKGNFKIAPNYKFVKPFEQGSAAVWDGSFWQFIDTNGKARSPIKFASISSFRENKAFVTVPGPLYKLFDFATVNTTNILFESILSSGAS